MKNSPANSIKLYPNPATEGTITISNNLNIESIKIYSNLGKIIKSEEINNLKNITIDLPKETGIYFISLKDKNGIKTKSVMFSK